MKEVKLQDIIQSTEKFWLYNNQLYCSRKDFDMGTSIFLFKVIDLLLNRGQFDATLIRDNEHEKLTFIPKKEEIVLFHLFNT